MILFFLWLILFAVLIVIIFMALSLELEIKNLNINLPKVENRFIAKNIEVKIKFLGLTVAKIKLKDKNLKKQFKNFANKLEKNKNGFDMDFLAGIKYMNIDIERLSLEINLGLQDAALTAILVGFVATVLGIMLRNKVTDLSKQKYEVHPVYKNIDVLNIKLSGIFRLSLRNIIYMIFKFLEKRRVDKNGRTSNRRAYAYGNE